MPRSTRNKLPAVFFCCGQMLLVIDFRNLQDAEFEKTKNCLADSFNFGLPAHRSSTKERRNDRNGTSETESWGVWIKSAILHLGR